MAARTLQAQAVLTAKDNASGAFAKLAGHVKMAAAAMKQIGSPALSRQLGVMKQQAAAATLALAAPAGLLGAQVIARAAELETVMLDIAQKVDLTDEAMQALGKTVRQLAPQVGKTAQEMARGTDILAGFGLEPEKAIIAMKDVGKAATAYGAQVEDLAKAGFASMDNLKVPLDQLEKAFDTMAQAGKEGAFELKDMARYFTKLTAGAYQLGFKGVSGVASMAAALQIARKGAGDSEEAANNMANAFAKMVSPDTIKNFKKLGIDIVAVSKKAQTSIDPMMNYAEAVAKAVNLDKKTGKFSMVKLGELFGDMQVQNYWKPILSNLKNYQETRKKALDANGVVQKDFERRQKTMAFHMQMSSVWAQELKLSLGDLIMPDVIKFMEKFNNGLQSLVKYVNANPQLAKMAAYAGAAGAALVPLAMVLPLLAGGFKMMGAAVKFVAMAAFLPFVKVAKIAVGGFKLLAGAATLATFALRRFMVTTALALAISKGAALKGLAIVFLSLLSPVKLATAAIRMFGIAAKLALIGTGIGAVLVAIGAAGTFIYNNWNGIVKMFESFGAAFMKNIGPARGLMQPLIDGATWLWEKFSLLTGEIDVSGKKWEQWGASAGEAAASMIKNIQEAINYVIQIPAHLKNAFENIPSFLEGIGKSMIDGLGKKIEWLLDKLKSIRSFLTDNAFAKFFTGGDTPGELPKPMKQAAEYLPPAFKREEALGLPDFKLPALQNGQMNQPITAELKGDVTAELKGSADVNIKQEITASSTFMTLVNKAQQIVSAGNVNASFSGTRSMGHLATR